MAVPENPEAGGCFVWLISFLLLIFTVSGAIFLVLYMIQPVSTTKSWYPIIGVSLVCFPWFFWLLMIVYRIISRACGVRMICFGPFGSGHPDDDGNNAPAACAGPVNNNATTTAATSVYNNGVDAGGGGVPVDGILVTVNRNENEDGDRDPGSPRRVHFGGVVILGEDDASANENQGIPRSLSRASSSSSSSRHSNESELPLKLSMA